LYHFRDFDVEESCYLELEVITLRIYELPRLHVYLWSLSFCRW